MNPDIAVFAQVMTIIVATIAALVVIGLGTRILWRLGSRAKPSHALDAREHDDRLRHLETACTAALYRAPNPSVFRRVCSINGAHSCARARRKTRHHIPDSELQQRALELAPGRRRPRLAGIHQHVGQGVRDAPRGIPAPSAARGSWRRHSDGVEPATS